MVSHSKMGMTTMRPNLHTPQHALNKAFRKVKPSRDDLENFVAQLSILIDSVSTSVKVDESEEHNKQFIIDFFNDTHYSDYFVNTKKRFDLVIREGKAPDTPVNVILETKRPDNKSEMLTRDDINRKALHELILYYMRERVTNENLYIKHLIVTNAYEWFIFDASDFEKTFVNHKGFLKLYKSSAEKGLVFNDTKSFYERIAMPFVKTLSEPLPCTYVDLRKYLDDGKDESVDEDKDENAPEKKLITLYKLFSPEHLLKLPFANDSNTLDRRFYAELLHIIGLSEVKEGGKKLIKRQVEGERSKASLIENAILQLDSRISYLEHPAHYGNSRQEQLFNVALELVITWINRILFLKLLESQLKSYNKGQEGYSFLNIKRLRDYGELNSLFFQVLAKPVDKRTNTDFSNVPYLNSSLFEESELERKTLLISNLQNNRELDLFPQTVLKDASGKKRTGSLSTLQYLFEFLDAYDFSSEGSETVQEESKTLINASVLGLIFEKINGYKDGSFFTPGFITMYMCRESIRRAVVQKFNAKKGWDCKTFDDLRNKRIDDVQEANRIVNSLKICDPAVGSGHFLVSALNELLAVKNELEILVDSEGRKVLYYELAVDNDELIVIDENGDLFEYNPRNSKRQRVQKTLFREKQILIENCLFGVDINPNSVKICRLRLWIELLKHAYYKEDGQLETLPNIDINIKVGNSLISRFPLDADLKNALKKSDHTIESYQKAVNAYRNPKNKEEKREMERLIGKIKNNFRAEILLNDPKMLKLKSLRARLGVNWDNMFADAEVQTKEQQKEQEKIQKQLTKLEKEIAEIENNKIFENAFEWRFEFPEVLDDDGAFVGFDVVIGNTALHQNSRVEEV